MENTKKLTGKDLINVGIYTAMTLVIFFVVGLLTALPVVYPFLFIIWPIVCGIGFATGKASEAIARQPEAAGKINSALLLGCALAEGTAIFGFITALLVIFMG